MCLTALPFKLTKASAEVSKIKRKIKKYFHFRLSNHPDLIRILLIFLESQPICDQDRKNPDFEICSDIFKRILIVLRYKYTELKVILSSTSNYY